MTTHLRTFLGRLAPLLLLALGAGPAPAANGPGSNGQAPAGKAAADQVPEYTIQQFLGTTTMSGSSFSPDGTKILVSSNQTGVFNAYAVPVDGGAAQPLTRSTADTILVRGYFPADERFVYESDQGGNELTHVYVRELDGTARDLTPGEKLKAFFVGYSRDDRTLFLQTNERDPKVFDLYEVSLDGYGRTLLYKNAQALDVGAISPDRRWLALTKPIGTSEVELYLHDRTSGETKKLGGGDGVSANPQEFTPDGKALLFTTDEGSEFQHLVRQDLATGARQEILRPDWDVTSATFSRDGRYLTVAINADARTEVRLFEAAALQPVALPKLPDADITSVNLSRDGRRLAFYADTSRSPRNLYVHDLGAGAAPRRLTQNLNPAIDPEHLVEGKVVRFRSYDGVEIPGILYLPHQARSGAKLPALVSVHGGPGDQSRLGYSGLTQFLANHGYVVYSINNRGSSGYGKTFYKMDDRKHGNADLDDCVASKKMLVATGAVDPQRIGIMGGSYGGYMVLAAMAFRPREFEVGVNLFGVANWLRTLESIPPWWESARQAIYKELGDPAVDQEYLRRISPLFHADKIERPLIVLQGANDPRVLKVESDEIVAAARKRGVPVEYVVFDDEGHGFVKKQNQEKAYTAILAFLDRHLKGDAGRKEA
ncbi:MAG TPA: S9 family peptidase [Thermoanaerobaculia bacterium]|nr:S9 family peptidase [Thermoanaerobaculia bacterium]